MIFIDLFIETGFQSLIKKPFGFEAIFNELPQSLWPALPESYEWHIDDSGGNRVIHLFKHNLAPDYDFDFVTYSTDVWPRFNFLSRWDNVTHHAFAYTRSSALRCDDARKDPRASYPMNPFCRYDRGHCIDYCDTQGLSEKSILSSGVTRIEGISTFDPRNYIPEPLIGAIGVELLGRNLLVKFERRGDVMLNICMHYGLSYERTTDETATAIPLGIYFMRTRSPDARYAQSSSYYVPWDGTIHKMSGDAHWSHHLQTTCSSPGNFYPTPFVYDVRRRDIDELPTDYVSSLFDRPPHEYYRVLRAADHEVRNVTGKILLSCYLLSQTGSLFRHHSIQHWLKRLGEHADALHERGSYGFWKSPLWVLFCNKLRTAKEVDARFSDWFRQLSSNDQALAQGKHKSSLSPLVVDSVAPFPELRRFDAGAFNKNYKAAAQAIANQLQKDPRGIYIVSITTEIAKYLADFLPSSCKEQTRIEYTLKKEEGAHISGIREKLVHKGIQMKLVEAPIVPGVVSSDHTAIILRTSDVVHSEDQEVSELLERLKRLSTEAHKRVQKALQEEEAVVRAAAVDPSATSPVIQEPALGVSASLPPTQVKGTVATDTKTAKVEAFMVSFFQRPYEHSLVTKLLIRLPEEYSAKFAQKVKLSPTTIFQLKHPEKYPASSLESDAQLVWQCFSDKSISEIKEILEWMIVC